MKLEDFGFDERGQIIEGWVNPNQRTHAQRRSFWRDRRGFGHWVAQAMGVGAMFVLFNYLWPAAKSMMNSTVTNMTTLNHIMQSSLSGLTIAATGSTITVTFPSGYTPLTTASDYTVTVNSTSDSVSNAIVSGQIATLTVSAAMNAGDTVSLTYTDGTATYTGTGTAS